MRNMVQGWISYYPERVTEQSIYIIYNINKFNVDIATTNSNEARFQPYYVLIEEIRDKS